MRSPRELFLVFQRGLLQLFGSVGSGIFLLCKLVFSGRGSVGLGGLLSSIGATAVGLRDVGFLSLEAINLLLGLLNVLQIL